MARAAQKRSRGAVRQPPRKAKPRSADAGEAAWNEAQARRELHAQLCRTMGEFLDLSSVPERGRIAIVAKITHRARQGVSRWFKQDGGSGALPDALSLYLFAHAFQADANYLFGFTNRRRQLSPPTPVSGHQAGRGTPQGAGDHVIELAREIEEHFPASASITMVGDEMEPTIKRGTKVFLDDSCTTIQGNGVYALDVDGRAIVRIVEDRPGEGVTLSCENKRYREQTILRADLAQSGIKVLGKVVGWFQMP